MFTFTLNISSLSRDGRRTHRLLVIVVNTLCPGAVFLCQRRFFRPQEGPSGHPGEGVPPPPPFAALRGGARCLLTAPQSWADPGLAAGPFVRVRVASPLALGGSSTVPSVPVGPALGALGFCMAAPSRQGRATAEGLHLLCGPWHKMRRLSS